MAVALDVSATLSWLVADERDESAVAMAQAVLERGAVVPDLWRLELRNALLTAQRRRRLRRPQVDELLSDLRRLPIVLAPYGVALGDDSELTLARKHGLSVYDAAYLAVAIRTSSPLMTRDDELGKAAADLGLRWHPD